MFVVPGEEWDVGQPRPRLVVPERGRPHTIWVNRSGRRFVDESAHNSALALTHLDPGTNRPANLPAWVVGDACFGPPPAGPPGWVVTAGSLAELAEASGIDRAGLAATVERFNALVAAGHDDDFGRGDTLYDRHLGDPSAPHPNLGTIAEPPFFAIRLDLGTVGTKGGLRTDAGMRVLHVAGGPVPGLFAAGNASAAPLGPGTIAPGLTLGLALTGGWLAGTNAASGQARASG